MADQRLRIKNFAAGMSDDDTLGPKNSFGPSQSVDFRTNLSRLHLQRAMSTEASGSGFLGPRSWDSVRIKDGTMYFANGGFLYKRTPGTNGAVGVYTEETSGGGHIPCADLDYRPDMDALFLYTSNAIHEYSPLSGTPTYKLYKYGYWAPDQATVNAADVDSTATLGTAIGESAAERYGFTCTHEPINRIQFVTDTLGTGDWTLTVHNNANDIVATQTITNANLPVAGDMITFNNFTGLNRLTIGQQYHLHLTVSTGTSKVVSGTVNDMTTAAVFIYYDRLVTTSAFVGHATLQLGAKTYFANERYIGEWEFLDLSGGNTTTGYDPHKIELPPDFTVIGLASYSEYLAAGCAISDSIENTSGGLTGMGGKGALIFWDLTSSTFNFIVEVPQGIPQGIKSYNNRVYFVASGRLCYWAGGDIVEVFEFPGVANFLADSDTDAPRLDTYLSAGRHCMATHNGLLAVGYPLQTANVNLKIGVYTFGRVKSAQPEANSFDFVTCNGNTATTFDSTTSPNTPATGISLLSAHSGTLLAAWTHGLGSTNSGIDRVNQTSLRAATGKWRSLWFDNDDPDIAKIPKVIKVTFAALPAGCTITPVVEYDRSGVEKTGIDSSNATIKGVAGDIDVVFPLDSSDNFYTARFGFNIASTSGNDVDVGSATFKFDDNRHNTLATEEHRSAS